MLMVLFVVYLAVQVLLWSLLFAFGAWLYKRCRLRALPWLGAYLVVSFHAEHVMNWVFVDRLIDGPMPPNWTRGEFTILLYYSDLIVTGIGRAIMAVLILAEVTALLARVTPAVDVWPFRWLLAVRERAGLLGAALLALALAGPVAAGTWWLTHPGNWLHYQ